MFFYISKILSGLFFIYPLFIFFSLIAAWRMRPGLLRKMYFVFWIVVYLCSTNFIASMLMRSLENRYAPMSIEQTPQADAIVLLGGMLHPLVKNESRRPEFLGSVDRVLLAEDLMLAEKAPVLVISGGNGLMMQNGPREADLLSSYLLGRGLAPEALLVESDSRNTAENARQVARLAEGRGWQKILLVTSAFHMPRAMACFHKVQDAGPQEMDQNEPGRLPWQVIPVPVDYYAAPGFIGPESVLPSPSAMLQTTLALKEYLGFMGYWFAGYI